MRSRELRQARINRAWPRAPKSHYLSCHANDDSVSYDDLRGYDVAYPHVSALGLVF